MSTYTEVFSLQMTNIITWIKENKLCESLGVYEFVVICVTPVGFYLTHSLCLLALPSQVFSGKNYFEATRLRSVEAR